MRPQRWLVVRALWLNARRAGLRRSLYRLRRLTRMRLLDPYKAGRLYPLPNVHGPLGLTTGQHRLLARLARLRLASPLAGAWDRDGKKLTFLNQPPFSLASSPDWLAPSVADPQWAAVLHSWEWAWPALTDAASRDALFRLWRRWVAKVPIGRGQAWKPHPTALRLTVWTAAWHLLGGDKELAAVIGQQAAFLADHLERDLDNNHLVTEAKALAWVGLLLPDLPQAQHWRRLGLDLLWETLAAQVRNDGSHIENSTSYHVAVWLDGLETALLCQASGEGVPAAVWATLARVGEYALALRRPDGRLPMLNDSIEDHPLPVRTLFSLAATALDRPDFAWAAGEENARPPSLRSQTLPDSGYVVLRAGTDPNDTYLVFDAGDLAAAHCPGHGHADTLSIELWGRGEALILDPGTYQHAAGPWRDYFRGTAAHSTATIDGLDQSRFAGPFRVADMAHGRMVSVQLAGSSPEVVGEHEGYARLVDPVLHRRRLRLHRPDFLEIEDTFSGQEGHDVVLRLHLAPSQAQLQGATSARAIYPGGTQLRVGVEGSEPGTLSIEEGWISRSWYRKEASPVLAYSLQARLPVTVTTFLTIV